jgi:UDP-N-acetylglucosamine 2-epimerase (non-hydrolysing)
VPILGDHPRAVLTEPLDYAPFVHAMRRADVILTDSGGVQEEAPAFGKPILVLRETTERPEGVRRAQPSWSAQTLRGLCRRPRAC